MVKTKVIRLSDIGRCPHSRLDPAHYRDDGSCECFPPPSGEPQLVFLHWFGDRLVVPPRGAFEGVNLMTPDVLGYVTAADGNVVEVSAGTGFDHEPIYGVTWASPRPDPDPSRLCRSWDEIEEVIGAHP